MNAIHTDKRLTNAIIRVSKNRIPSKIQRNVLFDSIADILTENADSRQNSSNGNKCPN